MDAQRGIARRTVIGLPPDGLSPAWEKDFAAYPPAGVILFKRDFRDLEDLRRLTGRLRGLARPRRLLLAIDEEGGTVSQLADHLTVPPNALLLGRGAGPGDIEWASRVTAERLRALGIDWVFAPVADIHSEPRNPVIGPRAYGTEAETVGRRVGEALKGFRAGRVANCLKHFPGHGDTVVDSHLGLPKLEHGRDRLEQHELVPFRANLDADAVMTAHLLVSALDAEHPATFSRPIAHRLLREELGFAGVSITDALEMKGAAQGVEPQEAARLALEAGCDLLLFAFHDENLRRMRYQLAQALVDGTIDRGNFDAARPRLEHFGRAHPEPSEAELTRPLESLTPPDWDARLERIIERGIELSGTLAREIHGPWEIVEDEVPAAMRIRPELERLGVPIAEASAASARMVFVARRTPLPADVIERLQHLCRERPTILVGLQNDSFLEEIPEAALRLSAADGTPLTRRVVARTLASRIHRSA